jgi:enediyne biosynthesis protein CalE5
MGHLIARSTKVRDKIVELSEIKPGDNVLDIATRIGEPAVTAAWKVMPNGKVVGTDISPQIVAIARTRAKSFGLDSIVEFRESDADKLDLPQSIARFDAILSRWGLMFLPNLHAALVGMRQKLITIGRLSAAVWSVPSKVPCLDLAFSAVRKQMDAPTPSPALPGPFGLANAEALKQSLSQAGFKDIKTEIVQITFGFDSPESYTKFHRQNTAPIRGMLASHP